MNENFGKITQVIGPVVDVTFEGEGNHVPEIYTALSVARHDGTELMLEVEQHIGENTVRCVAMDSTDTVVMSNIMILIADVILTLLLL